MEEIESIHGKAEGTPIKDIKERFFSYDGALPNHQRVRWFGISSLTNRSGGRSSYVLTRQAEVYRM